MPAVVELFCRYEERFRGAADTVADDITGDWTSSGFDVDRNTLVLEQDGVPVGYAVHDGDGFSDSVTALDARPLLGLLLDWLESRGAALEHYVPDTDPELAALLEQRRWEPARRFWRMRRDLDGTAPEPVWPAGIRVRDYDRPADDRAVHRLITEATTASSASWPSTPGSAAGGSRSRCCTRCSGGTPPAGCRRPRWASTPPTRPERWCSTRGPGCACTSSSPGGTGPPRRKDARARTGPG